MLDSFLARGLGQKEAVGELLIIMSAGIETTTTAITSILFLILSTPGVHSKLQAEIDAAMDLDPSFPAEQATINALP
ncbi:uncharacterized protein BDZ99DRAFT_523089 [Mytilinidion resinicola]|uniref:Cytochrome P450 n=1 Tax=Mytilinidion resinicola TaxID=574789 RepID=A0A6A6YHJ1_9PEZI|nr:uncharacterized protein BDZ99DRAFT_523089 [Mytilinidion resinicola]KAF2807475.1 hypothetical protein BDZ99DRAFT_523089 [Mytilinidion resinicola]